MNHNATPLGFRIVGPCNRERKLVDYDLAFSAYANCEPQAELDKESFLSPFQYDDAMLSRMREPASMVLDVGGFDGRCWSRFVWFDIDDDGNLERATASARRLVSLLLDRYRVDESELLIFFSGSKGYHVGLPTSLFAPEPSTDFHRIIGRLAEAIAANVSVKLDTSIYSIVQPLRAPNSTNGKTGLHKRFLTVDELLKVRLSAIVDRAAQPLAFELPDSPDIDERAVKDWIGATELTRQQAEAVKVEAGDRSELNRSTLEFIADGAEHGDRHRLLYSAAANLAEFGCPARLAHALLTEAALNSGLPPADIKRAIENGIKKGGSAT